MPIIMLNSRQADGRPFMNEGEDLRLSVRGITAVFDDQAPSGSGSLFVTTRNVIWLSDQAAAPTGFAIDFRSIAVHAISSDPTAFPQPHLYLQLQNADDEEEPVRELRLVPGSNDISLEQLFKTMSDCAALNPDPVEPGDSDDDDDEDGNEAIRSHLESVFHPPEENGNGHNAAEPME